MIDAVVRTLDPKLPYDTDGKLAGAGTSIDSVVDDLLAAPYFSASSRLFESSSRMAYSFKRVPPVGRCVSPA